MDLNLHLKQHQDLWIRDLFLSLLQFYMGAKHSFVFVTPIQFSFYFLPICLFLLELFLFLIRKVEILEVESLALFSSCDLDSEFSIVIPVGVF